MTAMAVIALMIKPDEHPCVVPLLDNAEYLNHAVSIDTDIVGKADCMSLGNGVCVIFASQGTAFGQKGNRRVGKYAFAGTIYIVGMRKGKLRSLTDDEIAEYTIRYWEPDIICEDELHESWFDLLFDGA